MTDNFIMTLIVCTAIIVVLLIILGATLLRAVRKPKTVFAQPSPELAKQIERLERAATQHADILAILEAIKQYEGLDPATLERFKSYPQVVRMATLQHYVGILEGDLQYAQQQRSDAEQLKGAYKYKSLERAQIVKYWQERIQQLRAELNNTTELLQEEAGLHTV